MKTRLLFVCIIATQLINAQQWEQVGSGIDGNVICMEALNGKLYVGGNYTGTLNYISEYDPATGIWTDISNDFITFAIMGMTVSDGLLYVSGLYQWTSGDIVASYDPTTGIWTGLGNGGGVNAVSEIFVKDGYLYTGGNGYSKKTELGSGLWEDMAITDNAGQVRGFADVNGTMYVHKVETADNWDGYSFLTYDETAEAFAGEAMDGLTYNWFQDLEVVDDKIYCAGSFYVNDDFQRIALYNTQTGTYSGLPGCPENSSQTISRYNDMLFFGGSFQSPYDHVVAYTMTDGSWMNIGDGINAQVSELVVLGDSLYAIGTFYSPILHVAKFALADIVGIEEQATPTISAYPNPCKDVLRIQSVQNKTICIYDILGKEAWSGRCTNGEIDLAQLPSGCYEVCTENGTRLRVIKE